MVKNRIRERRAELGVTQKWLAEECGVSHIAISEIENGVEAKVITAYAIAKALHTTIEYLWMLE